MTGLWARRLVLPHAATHCNTQQYTPTYCNTRVLLPVGIAMAKQCGAVWCSVVKGVAMWCSVVQCIATANIDGCGNYIATAYYIIQVAIPPYISGIATFTLGI